jgi:DNA (cytosine-5)-methyltransferase 1
MYPGDNQKQSLTCVSLFTGGGIGDLALRACGVDVLVASELLEDRVSVYRANYPETEMIPGDICANKDRIVSVAQRLLGGRPLDILFATPPCQGMSKNGRGKLLQGIRAGQKPEFDPRNILAFNAIDIAFQLAPRIIVFENVPEMEDTLVEHDGVIGNLLDMIKNRLPDNYEGKWEVVEFADYGVPQCRQRLITVFTRDSTLKLEGRRGGTFLPPRTHSQKGSFWTHPWVTVNDALRGIPPLDAASREKASHSDLPYHNVPVLDRDKYFWVSNTPPGKGAMDNQCVNPECRFGGTPTHGSEHDENGINKARTDTPVRCVKCGELLPRPWVVEDGQHRLMKAFTSAYRRMRGDRPASALTRNLSYACSDQKLHPTENRVLSLHEAFILHTVSSYDFKWMRDDGKPLSDKTIREIIGESIPPKGLEKIFSHVCALLTGERVRPSLKVHPSVVLPDSSCQRNVHTPASWQSESSLHTSS